MAYSGVCHSLHDTSMGLLCHRTELLSIGSTDCVGGSEATWECRSRGNGRKFRKASLYNPAAHYESGLLGDIARELNPYPKELEEGGVASALLALTGALKVEKIKTDPAGNAFTGEHEIEAFTVSVLHQDPGTAMKVTARIAEK